MMVRQSWLLFAIFILAGCGAAGEPVDRLAVDALVIETSATGQITAVVSGYLLDTCTQIDRTDQTHSGDTITLTLIPNQPDSLYCPKLFAPFDLPVTLNTDGLPAGQYTVTAGGESATFSLP
ncbi:MAG: hypothetical protein Kow0031_03180 [Anaerolineae bacterium]